MAASIKTTMTVGGHTYLLSSCTYNLRQPIDHLGRASAGVRSGLIEISILGNDQNTLQQWAIDPLKMFDGEIRYVSDENTTFKTLTFNQAYCVSYQETLVPGSGSIAYEFELGISAAQLIVNGILHDNQWSDLKDTY